MNRILALVIMVSSGPVLSLDWDNDKERKEFGRSTWVHKISRDLKCAHFVKSEDSLLVYDFYMERVETSKKSMAMEMFGYTDSEIGSVVNEAKKETRKLPEKLVSKDSCLDAYAAAKELADRKLRDGTPGNCISGAGATDKFEMPKAILEGATDHKVVDGFREFKLPEGYTTDEGVVVHLKQEVMVYKVGERQSKKVFLSEADGKIQVREEDYIELDNERLCIETSFIVG